MAVELGAGGLMSVGTARQQASSFIRSKVEESKRRRARSSGSRSSGGSTPQAAPVSTKESPTPSAEFVSKFQEAEREQAIQEIKARSRVDTSFFNAEARGMGRTDVPVKRNFGLSQQGARFVEKGIGEVKSSYTGLKTPLQRGLRDVGGVLGKVTGQKSLESAERSINIAEERLVNLGLPRIIVQNVLQTETARLGIAAARDIYERPNFYAATTVAGAGVGLVGGAIARTGLVGATFVKGVGATASGLYFGTKAGTFATSLPSERRKIAAQTFLETSSFLVGASLTKGQTLNRKDIQKLQTTNAKTKLSVGEIQKGKFGEYTGEITAKRNLGNIQQVTKGKFIISKSGRVLIQDKFTSQVYKQGELVTQLKGRGFSDVLAKGKLIVGGKKFDVNAIQSRNVIKTGGRRFVTATTTATDKVTRGGKTFYKFLSFETKIGYKEVVLKDPATLLGAKSVTLGRPEGLGIVKVINAPKIRILGGSSAVNPSTARISSITSAGGGATSTITQQVSATKLNVGGAASLIQAGQGAVTKVVTPSPKITPFTTPTITTTRQITRTAQKTKTIQSLQTAPRTKQEVMTVSLKSSGIIDVQRARDITGSRQGTENTFRQITGITTITPTPNRTITRQPSTPFTPNIPSLRTPPTETVGGFGFQPFRPTGRTVTTPTVTLERGTGRGFQRVAFTTPTRAVSIGRTFSTFRIRGTESIPKVSGFTTKFTTSGVVFTRTKPRKRKRR